ncbi:MAG: energy-coupling factor ABC transporter substrate-binding protein, partial [Coriobacteriia bacterium]|nr:energy-coupling factor ABC transporter substrate-binding protein [Coriobacteriia bacterium]
MKRRDIMMLLLVVALVVLPLVIVKTPVGTEGFAGADAQANELIGKIAPSYQPWFQPIWTPPSGEVESLIFALQACLGAGFIGYYLG